MENEIQVTRAKAHKPQLVLNRDVHKQVHGDNLFGRFNTRIAVIITKSVGSMWCAYVFALISLVALPAAILSHDPIIIVAWISQAFLQLVLLPIIIVGQNVQAQASDARALSDHETLLAIHTIVSEIHRINEQQDKILKLLKERSTK
jgi:predicted aconitase with swiveling domain